MRLLPQRLRQPTGIRFAALLLLLGLLGLAVLVLPRPELDRVPELLDRLGPLAPAAPVLIGAALLMALVPRTFVTLAWGALFGPLDGAGYALAAALLAAAAGFGVGRLLGRDFVAAQSGVSAPQGPLAGRIRRQLARLDGWSVRSNLLGVLAVRLLPVGGFGLVSYGYGVTGVRPIPYLLGTVLASTPSAFGYAAVGAAVVAPQHVSWLAVAPAVLGLVATAALVAQWRRRTRIPTF
ncbi:MAG TPA: VTT domain-containing protein [Micromonosporaceae bacterium]|nr:VTT domain-containing protein [Micromonosporaceae bacterium]